MITGVWLSPDSEKVRIQVYEEEIFEVDAVWVDKRPELVGEVPDGWSALYDTTNTNGSDT
jgi:hypothetical protein